MIYPNGQRVLTYPIRNMAGALVSTGAMQYGGICGARFNRFVSETTDKRAGVPNGYSSPVLPIKAGGMSSLRGILTVSGSGDMLQGGPMEGTGDMSFTTDSNLSLVISMSANASVVTMTGDSMVLRLTVGLDGTGAFQLTGENNLALIVPFEGAGSVLTMGAGATDLRGLLSMQGEWTPFTELSPEGLASAVWGSMASAYNDAGTMGEKLNGAGSAGNPWTEVIESGLTASQVMRIIASAVAGTSQKTGSTIVFKGLDGTTDRITGSFDVDGNRTGSIVDGT